MLDAECALGEPMRRVPEVIDVWFDSGAMPFAQHHFPFEHEQAFESGLPGRLHLRGAGPDARLVLLAARPSPRCSDRPAPYRNVVCLGPDPRRGGPEDVEVARATRSSRGRCSTRYGADAFRWYFFTSKQPWDGYRFSAETIGEGVRLFLKQLWSTYYFYALYAHASAERLSQPQADAVDADSDDGASGAHARTGAAATRRSRPLGAVTRRRDRRAGGRALEAYDATNAGRAIAELVDELSNWYVRRSRRRFWEGELRAFETLRTCLLTVAKLLAPFCPFIADEIYDNLDGELASVHLCDFPTGAQLGARDEELEQAMALARETVRLGLGARGQAKIKVRQPLREAVVVADGRERDAIERLAGVVREELNVRARALRGGRGRARQLRGEGQLPHARAAVRPRDAAGSRGDRGARPGARGGGDARRRGRSGSRWQATSTR